MYMQALLGPAMVGLHRLFWQVTLDSMSGKSNGNSFIESRSLLDVYLTSIISIFLS